MFYGQENVGVNPKPAARVQRIRRDGTSGGGFTKKLASAPQLYKEQTGVSNFYNGQYCVSTGN